MKSLSLSRFSISNILFEHVNVPKTDSRKGTFLILKCPAVK